MLTKRIKGIPEALQGLVPHVVTLQQPRRSRGWLGSLALLWVAQASLLSQVWAGTHTQTPRWGLHVLGRGLELCWVSQLPHRTGSHTNLSPTSRVMQLG